MSEEGGIWSEINHMNNPQSGRGMPPRYRFFGWLSQIESHNNYGAKGFALPLSFTKGALDRNGLRQLKT